MPDKDPSLDAAYALQTPEDSKRLYADWAQSYDETFAKAMDYRMPQAVAALYAEDTGRAMPLLDVGAGTGLVGAALSERDALVIDALDISRDMLDVAQARGVYRQCLQCDLTQRLPIKDGTYGTVISAGTFTHGHVGPDALDELLRVAQYGAHFILGINAEHYASEGFEAKFATLDPHIEGFELREVPIYGGAADVAHRGDMAQVAVFRKVRSMGA